MKMKLDFTGLSMDPKVYDFETGELLTEAGDRVAVGVRPYPAELTKVVITPEGMVVDGAQTMEIFAYCLTDLYNFEGADGVALTLTDGVKEALFKYNPHGIRDFVIQRSRDFQDAKGASERD